MSEPKERLDVLLTQKGFFKSRENARARILAGEIFVDGIRVDKCGEKVKIGSNIEFKGDAMPFVSRGGYKLDKALKTFGITLCDKVCIDIGASTGGFTDCMLQNGAEKVYAIDVGYGQFAWKLRIDPHVVCMERTNIRYVTREMIDEPADFCSIDVSFISLEKVIPAALNLLTESGEIAALIKPQFEAGREKVGKNGVVREKSTHIEVINKIVQFAQNLNLNILNIDFSPIKGPKGNIEYLLYLSKNKEIKSEFSINLIDSIVEEAHNLLNGEKK